MKSMLYVGATLMIGASIYGFVDYKKTSQQKEFTSMYEEKKAPVVKEVEPGPVPAVSKEIVTKEKKMAGQKQSVKKEEEVVVAPVEPISEENRIAAKETKEIAKTTVDINVSDKNDVVKKVKKKKKINSRLFSRAPLREEEYIPEPVKEETKKMENKEQ